MRRTFLLSLVLVAGLAGAHLVGSLVENPSPASAQGGAAPEVTTGEATEVAQQTAKLNGTVNPRGSATTYTFQVGTTTNYGLQTTPASAGAGTTANAVSQTLTGLAPGTTYHYRLVATNAAGQTTNGADRTFTTPSRTSKLNLFGRTSFVGPGRQVGVFTGCIGDRPCRGSLRMTNGGTTIGSRRSFSIGANGGGIVHVPLNATGRRRLAAARSDRLRVSVTVSSSDAGSDTESMTVVRYR